MTGGSGQRKRCVGLKPLKVVQFLVVARTEVEQRGTEKSIAVDETAKGHVCGVLHESHSGHRRGSHSGDGRAVLRKAVNRTSSVSQADVPW